MFENHSDATERLTAKHAEARIELCNGLNIEDLRQGVLLLRILVLEKDAVHFLRDGPQPPLRAHITVLTLLFRLCVRVGDLLESHLIFAEGCNDCAIFVLFLARREQVPELVIVLARVQLSVPFGPREHVL